MVQRISSKRHTRHRGATNHGTSLCRKTQDIPRPSTAPDTWDPDVDRKEGAGSFDGGNGGFHFMVI